MLSINPSNVIGAYIKSPVTREDAKHMFQPENEIDFHGWQVVVMFPNKNIVLDMVSRDDCLLTLDQLMLTPIATRSWQLVKNKEVNND